VVNFIKYSSLGSTNDTAKTLPNPVHGTVIMADIQTAGRGRYARKFFSPPGCGIYMSIILTQQYQSRSLITPAAAVAVCEAIENFTDNRPQIKWVNDIFLNGRKICGILTEALADRIVVGIGINFIMPPGGFPPEISQTAGVLFGQSPASLTREQLAEDIAKRLLSDDFHMDAYKKRLLVLGRRISVITPNMTYEAVAIDIDENAGLIVQNDSGEITTLTAGEVSLKL